MIKRIYRSESDLYNLSLKRTENLNQGVNLDYKNIVVNKPWGYEYLLFENKYVAIWVLCLKKNGATSMHCHPNKKTSLLVLSGLVISSTLDTEFKLAPNDGLIIDSGVFHSTKSISDEDTFLIEVETPPDKNDLVRLKDQYGRENKCYEGAVSMSKDLSNYHYCDFHSLKNGMERRNLVSKNMILVKDQLLNILNNNLSNDTPTNICLLDGCVTDTKGQVIVNVGEVVTDSFLRGLSGRYNQSASNILLIY